MTLTAYRSTVAGGSADVATTFSYGTGGGSTSVTSSGVFSWSSDLGEMTSRYSLAGASFTTVDIVDGHDEYTKMSVAGAPAAALGLGDGTKWSETVWSGHSGANLMSSLFFGSPNPPSPGSLLQLLESHVSSVADVGSDSIGGVRTTHYRALVPFSALGGHPSAADLEQARQVLGTTMLTFDFWVDSSDLLRQLTFGITMHKFPPDQGGGTVGAPKLPITIGVTLSVSNYGVAVDVTPPPPDEVTKGGTCQTTSNGFNCDGP